MPEESEFSMKKHQQQQPVQTREILLDIVQGCKGLEGSSAVINLCQV